MGSTSLGTNENRNGCAVLGIQVYVVLESTLGFFSILDNFSFISGCVTLLLQRKAWFTFEIFVSTLRFVASNFVLDPQLNGF